MTTHDSHQTPPAKRRSGLGYRRVMAAHPIRRVRRFAVAFVAAAMLSTVMAVAPAGSTAAATTPFDDVPEGLYYTAAVAWLADAGITTGTSPTTFSPNDPVTRAQMAAFLQRYAQVTDVDASHRFIDVPAGAFYDEAVAFLVDREITTGTSPVTYSPNDVVTRAQMAAFLWRFSLEPNVEAGSDFADVPDGRYYTDAVAWLADKGITTGTSPTTYSPDDAVTRAQMATFLWRLAGMPNVGELGANRVDTEATEVVEEDDLGDDTTIDIEGTSTLEFVDERDVPEVGDVVVMGITDETPEGFIGMVESASGTMVTTSPATLQDAIPEADVQGTFDFDEIADLQTNAVTDRFKGVEASCAGGGSVTLEVDFGIDAGVDLEASWDPFGDGVEAYVGMSATATAGVEVIATGEVECEAVKTVDGPKLKPITFWLGPVPVVLVPEISFEAVIGGSFKAEASVGMFYEQTVAAGLRYSDADGWSTEYSNTRRIGSPEVNFAAQVTAGIELRARLDLKVYGAAGPYLTVGPYFEINVQNNIPWWNIDAGVRASVGAAIDVFFFKDEVQFAEVDLVRFRLADSGLDPFPGGYQLLEGQPLNAVEAGSTSCGIDGGGYGYCWGDNFWGQAGAGGGGTVATRVAGLHDIGFAPVVEIDSGGTHTCARHSDGTVSCWGNNDFGQLGDGTKTSRSTPEKVDDLTDVVELAVESSQTCVRHGDLTVSCWGRNGNFQTGQASGDGTRPQRVDGLHTIVDLGLANEHGCALMATGQVKCWGYNYGGQLGIGEVWQPPATSTIATPTPMTVVDLDDVVEIDGAHLAVCARKNDGTVWCWGEGNLGGGVTDSSVPVQVPGITDATDLAFDGSTGCVLDSDGLAWCWGSDVNGSLGNGAPLVASTVPVAVAGGSSFHSISIRGGTVCASYGYGVGLCWGENEFGSVGDGTTVDRAAPLNRVQNSATVS